LAAFLRIEWCMIRKLWIIGVLMALPGLPICADKHPAEDNSAHALYVKIFQKDHKPDFEAFEYCLEGFQKLAREGSIDKHRIVTLIDYSLPSHQDRLWVIDLEKDSVLFHSRVAHGRNSGEVLPTIFSNTPHSLMSSQGFFITGESYLGKHGYSLRLDGVESGINDKARQRAIVIHPASYVSTEFITRYGRLGRSWGCPALPPEESKPIIDLIKEKSCLYIYSPDPDYELKSDII
jgi:hypothetical protein